MSLTEIRRDFLEAARGLYRAPGFTVVVTLTLAVGLGGALATVSVMDRVLLRPPSGVSAPHELRRIYLEHRPRGQPNLVMGSLSYPNFEDLADAGRGRASLLLYAAGTWRLGAEGPAVFVEWVARDYFSVLGVQPMLGRFFTDEESRPVSPAIDPLVLSAAFWHREFSGDSSALGRTVTLNGRKFTVVGIAQADFRGMDLNHADVWAPLGSMLAPGSDEGGAIRDRGNAGWSVVARLESSTWPELLTRFSARLRETQHERSWADTGARVVAGPLRDSWNPGARGEFAVRNATLAVRLAFVSIAVLFVSILHGAIMLSLRALHRRREIAIRLALGMPRSRLVMHHILEALGVAVLAGGISLLFGWWGATVLDTRVLSALRPTPVILDGRLIATLLLLTAVTLALTGLAPALASRAISPTALRSDGVAGDSEASALRHVLVAAETAACVALVVLAALSLRSLQRITKADFGFDGDRLIMLTGPLGGDVSPLRERIAALPFVEAANIGDPLNSSANTPFAIPGRDPIPDSLAPKGSTVANGYLRTVGARLLQGRVFAETDVAGAERVVVITRGMASRFWPDASPLGQCILVFSTRTTCRYVVGVIEDIRWDPGLPAAPRYFVPGAQAAAARSRFMMIRTRQPALAVEAATIEEMARQQWVEAYPRPRAIRVVDALAPRTAPLRAASTLFLIFGVLALVSAAVGIFGLISYLISRRTREIGIRIALDATAPALSRLMARWAIAPLLLGVVLGVLAALAGGRLITAFLFETAGYDPLVFTGAIALVLVAALGAAFTPARRAVTLDPATALRID